MAGIVTFGSVFGDALKRAGARLPEAYLTMRELQERQAQNTRQTDLDEQEQSWRDWQKNRQQSQDVRQQEQDLLGFHKWNRSAADAMESEKADRQYKSDVLGETERHNKAMESRNTGGPSLLSAFTDRKSELTNRMGDLLSGAEAYDVAKGSGGSAIKDRTGLVRAAQAAANRQDTVISDAPGWFTGNDTTFVPRPDSTLLNDYLRPYDAANDSLNQARAETFGGAQPPINDVPANDGSMTETEYQQFVDDWKSGRVRF
jgi:hypothetical protein